jgi:hypothetical protein
MKVQFKVLRGSLSRWETLAEEAAEFASQIEPERLISISQSSETVIVWYWSDQDSNA